MAALGSSLLWRRFWTGRILPEYSLALVRRRIPLQICLEFVSAHRQVGKAAAVLPGALSLLQHYHPFSSPAPFGD